MSFLQNEINCKIDQFLTVDRSQNITKNRNYNYLLNFNGVLISFNSSTIIH